MAKAKTDERTATAADRASKSLETRLRAEFLEMPGLRLKPDQVQLLCGVERTICQMVLDVLVDEEFLGVTLDGQYARLTTGHHPHPAKADLRIDTHTQKVS